MIVQLSFPSRLGSALGNDAPASHGSGQNPLVEKHLLPPIATLRNMMGKIRNDNARETGHDYG